MLNATLAIMALAVSPSTAFAATRCPITPVALEVLGSGGPIAEGNRARTSYLLRIDGVPRLLIDILKSGSFEDWTEPLPVCSPSAPMAQFQFRILADSGVQFRRSSEPKQRL
jgi:hypothetical protein